MLNSYNNRPPSWIKPKPLSWAGCLYEFSNPRTGFHPCTLPEGWAWMKSIVASKLQPRYLALAIYNRATGQQVVCWDGERFHFKH